MSPTRFAALVLPLLTVPASASEAVPSLASGLGQMILGLGVVIALLLASLWLIKRLSSARGGTAGLKVLGAVPIGSRERVVLLEVADKVLVLGVSSASVTTLHTLDASALRDTTPAPPDPASVRNGGDFSRWLKLSLDRRSGRN